MFAVISIIFIITTFSHKPKIVGNRVTVISRLELA